MRLAAVVAVLVVAAAGCLAPTGPGSDEGAITHDVLLERLLEAVDGRDRPMVEERVRAREVDVATDPNNPLHLVATMMVQWPTQPAPYDGMGWTGLALSEDGGRSWTYRPLPGYPGDPNAAASPWAGAVFAGDPIVRFDRDGGFYLVILAIYPPVWITVDVAKYEWGSWVPAHVARVSSGALGVEGLEAVPTTQPLMHVDKEQLAVDPETGDLFLAWSDRLQATAQAQVVFSRSTDGGRTWTQPLAFAPPELHYLAGDEHQMGPWPVVTLDGRLLVVWADVRASGRLYVSESPDRGDTFLPPRLIDEQPRLWLPHVAMDRTGGPYHGTIYVVVNDQREGQHNAYLRHSRDGGETWSEAVRVNEDPVSRTRMPNLVVDPTGMVAVIYMADEGNAREVHAYLAVSLDGGETFVNARLSQEPTDPVAINNEPSFLTHLGDYIAVTWNDRGLVPMWQDGRQTTPDLPYSEIWFSEVPLRGGVVTA